MAKTTRQRDYKAEYARRIAKGRAAGKTRQQARGDRPAFRAGATEAGYRTERSRIKYGASPSVLRRLRERALAHVLGELALVKTAISSKVETLRRGLRMLHVETLREIIPGLTGRDIKAIAGQPTNDAEFWRNIDFNEIADAIDEDAKVVRNPFWYH